MEDILDLTGADLFAKKLKELGVKVAFVFTGGAIAAILDSLEKYGIDLMPYDHELDAAYAADGYVRATGLPTIVAVTSGPGATNLITGIAGSWFDSIPVLFVSGQVKSIQRTDFSLYLQRGFQEVDIVKSVAQFTKFARCVEKACYLEESLDQAFSSMVSGRPGPALLDITMDAQSEMLRPSNANKPKETTFSDCLFSGGATQVDEQANNDFRLVCDNMRKAEKPLLIIGGGVQWLPAALIKSALERLNVNVIFTYPGLNALPLTHHLNKGLIGPFGHDLANKELLNASDLFILGARLPHRSIPSVTETDLNIIKQKRKWILSLHPIELTCHPFGTFENKIRCNLFDFFKFVEQNFELNAQKTLSTAHQFPMLNNTMFTSKAEKDQRKTSLKECFNVKNLISSLNATLPDDANIYGDVGQNIVALATGLTRDRGQKLYSSWANSPMGYSLPAALGSVVADISRPAVCVIGDGGIRTALSSLPNLVSLSGRLKTILWDNGGYSTIVDHLEVMLDGRHSVVTQESGLAPFDIKLVLQAAGLSVTIASGKLEAVMREFFNNDKDVLVVPVDPSIRMVPLVNSKAD